MDGTDLMSHVCIVHVQMKILLRILVVKGMFQETLGAWCKNEPGTNLGPHVIASLKDSVAALHNDAFLELMKDVSNLKSAGNAVEVFVSLANLLPIAGKEKGPSLKVRAHIDRLISFIYLLAQHNVQMFLEFMSLSLHPDPVSYDAIVEALGASERQHLKQIYREVSIELKKLSISRTSQNEIDTKSPSCSPSKIQWLTHNSFMASLEEINSRAVLCILSSILLTREHMSTECTIHLWYVYAAIVSLMYSCRCFCCPHGTTTTGIGYPIPLVVVSVLCHSTTRYSLTHSCVCVCACVNFDRVPGR